MADLLQRICDACAHDDDRQTLSAQSITLTVDGRQHRLDLCADHLTRLWQPVAVVLGTSVTVAPTARPDPNPRSGDREEYACLDCDYASNSIGALSRHRSAEHGFVAYQLPKCPYCVRHDFNDRQTLSAHISASHRDQHIQRLLTERS